MILKVEFLLPTDGEPFGPVLLVPWGLCSAGPECSTTREGPTAEPLGSFRRMILTLQNDAALKKRKESPWPTMCTQLVALI